MNIALMSHDNRKDLMVQFCTAYAGILSQHHLYATNTTGHMVAEATGLKVHCFLSYTHGGNADSGSGTGRSGLAHDRQSRQQPAYRLTNRRKTAMIIRPR